MDVGYFARRQPARAKRAFEGESPRQREVLQLLAEGRSMKEAADILKVTPRTIAFHKSTMMNRRTETLGRAGARALAGSVLADGMAEHDGHVLMEGLPGVAKTRSIKTLGRLPELDVANRLEGGFIWFKLGIAF